MPWTVEVNTDKIALRHDGAGRVYLHRSTTLHVPEDDGTPQRIVQNYVHPVTFGAHRQIADRARIPWAYYQRMMERAPALLCDNVNHWWQARPELRVMVVNLNGEVLGWYAEAPKEEGDVQQAEAGRGSDG